MSEVAYSWDRNQVGVEKTKLKLIIIIFFFGCVFAGWKKWNGISIV